MKLTSHPWKVRYKNRFLLAVMTELAGDAHISFEGSSDLLGLAGLPGASQVETPVLKRHTIWPQQDFVIVPLEPSTIKAVYASIGGTVPRTICHIQIEKSGKLEFGAYDRFHPGSIFLGSAIAQAFIDSQISESTLRSLQL